MPTITYSTPGDFTWVAPTGVTSVVVKCRGPGGAGENGTSTVRARGGGGAGAYAQDTITVVPGNSYAVHVGAGGAAGGSTNNTYFLDTSTVFAPGGTHASGNFGGNGGASSSCVGTIKFSGGNGGDCGIGKTGGGGGGGGAGDAADGTIGTNGGLSVVSTGGPGGAGGSAGGGTGGAGGDNTLNGANGSTPGAGGGGAGGGTSTLAGNGADGKVTLTFSYPTVTPPVQPTYGGPSVLLRPISAEILYTASPANVWSNINNLVGAPDGSNATYTLDTTAGGNNSADTLLLRLYPPLNLLSCSILGYSYEFRGASQSGGNSITGIQIQPYSTSQLSELGNAEGVHEIFATSGDYGMAEYTLTEVQSISDRITQFQAGTNIGVGNLATFADLGGFIVRPYTNTPNHGTTNVALDTADLTVYYMPPDTGTPTTLTPDSVDVQDGATAGIPTDPLWGSELDWVNPSNALATDGSFAVATQDATDKASQTKFLRFRFNAGKAGLTLSAGQVACELRAVWRGYVDGNGNFARLNWASLGTIVVKSNGGTVLLNGAAARKFLYDALNYKVADQGTSSPNAKRDRPIALDISGLTATQLADMNANGFYVLIRFNINATSNTGTKPMSLYFDGVSFSVSRKKSSPVVRTRNLSGQTSLRNRDVRP